MDLKNSVAPVLEEPKAGGSSETPVVHTADNAGVAPKRQSLDPSLTEGIGNNDGPKSAEPPSRSKASPEQVQILEANREALRPFLDEFKGKAMKAFVNGEGPASAISDSQARYAISLIRGNEASPAPEHDGPVPPEAPEMSDPEPSNAFFNQPATEGQVREANRLLNNRLDQSGVPQTELMEKTNEMLGQWVAQGASSIPMSDESGSFQLETLTRGQFNEVKAASQSASIQLRAQAMDFEQMRPATETAPAMTIGQAAKMHVDADIAKMKLLPEPVIEAARTPEITKLLEAARGTNLSLVRNQADYNAERGTDIKVSLYDKAPEMETAAKYAIAKHKANGEDLTPESAAADMKEAISAGTHAQLYKNADAQGLPHFMRDVQLRERASAGQGPKAANDNAWTKEKINDADVSAVRAALGDAENMAKINQSKALSTIKQKIELGVPPEGFTKGDLATLRKEGLVDKPQKPGFDGKAPVSENVMKEIKDVAQNQMQKVLEAGLGVILLKKLKDLAEGKEVTFNKFDASDLRKRELLPTH